VKKRSTRARRSVHLSRRLPARSKGAARQVRQNLILELYGLVRDALQGLGISLLEQRGVQAQLLRVKTLPRVSGPLLRDWALLGAILLEWSREPEYLDDAGLPRVLAIRGPEGTFESLAQRFLPNMRLQDVVTMACETTEVAVRPGARIALLGSIMVSHVKSPERALAFAVTQIDQLLQTTVHNFVTNRTGRGAGRMQRIVKGVIARGEFDDFMSELRPQIYDLLMRVEAAAENHRPKNAKALRSATAVSVGVYVGQENDLQRAGVDASLVPQPAQKRKKGGA
jgi:hypothetical protein